MIVVIFVYFRVEIHLRKTILLNMTQLDIRQHVIQALEKLPMIQQLKLLEFINSMLAFQQTAHPKAILQFAGIFDEQDSTDFLSALEDCEQIDWQ